MPSLIPAGCTSVLQPLDVSLNQPFKSLVRHEWMKFMEEEVAVQHEEAARESDNPFSDVSDTDMEPPAKRSHPIKVKPASRQQIINWIATAWEKIKAKPDMVAKSFVVTSIAQDLHVDQVGTARSEDAQQEIVE